MNVQFKYSKFHIGAENWTLHSFLKDETNGSLEFREHHDAPLVSFDTRGGEFTVDYSDLDLIHRVIGRILRKAEKDR